MIIRLKCSFVFFIPDFPLNSTIYLSVSFSYTFFLTLMMAPAPSAKSSPYLQPYRMTFKNMWEYLAWLYYQYLLITGIYVLEPWEKSIFNSILFSAIVMVIYTSYVFVPIHVRLALKFFSGMFGGQPESTVALMT